MIASLRQILERVLNFFHANLRFHHHFSVEDTLPESKYGFGILNLNAAL